MKSRKYNKAYEGNYRSIERSVIPRFYLEEFCYSIKGLKVLGECPYYKTQDCPASCENYSRMQINIKHTAKLGIERFKMRYPNYANR